MESKKIYEESGTEIARIRKSILDDSLTIHMNKLDTETRGELVTAMQKVLVKRQREVEAVYLGVQ